jgi:hypothetical protein
MGRKNGSNEQRGDGRMAEESRGRSRLTRKQVAERLGMAENSVKRRDGFEFHPTRDGRFFFYDPAEVEAYAHRSGSRTPTRGDGEIAARAFELFKAGKDFRDVVIELRQHPARIRELFREYSDGLGVVVSAEYCRQIQALGHGQEGVQLTGESLWVLIRSMDEANGRISARSIEDFNRANRLKGELERANKRIAELATELQAAREKVAELEAAPKAPVEPESR